MFAGLLIICQVNMEIVSLCFEVVNILCNPQTPAAADVWKPESDTDLNPPGPERHRLQPGLDPNSSHTSQVDPFLASRLGLGQHRGQSQMW